MTTTYFLNCVMGNVFKTKTTPALPSAYYIGLSTTAPTVAGVNVSEPSSASGYKRVQLTSLSAPTDGAITNSSAVSFDESTKDWGVVTHFVIYDAATGGNLLIYDELSSPKTVEEDTIVTIKNGSIELTLANA